MNYRSTTTRHFGLEIQEHFLEVPWNWQQPAATFELYARELIPAGGKDLPMIVYLQGGPGCEAPRPLGATGLIGEMLKHYRVLLVDQRGTGRSHRIDSTSPQEDRSFERLVQLRQENIVRDLEALRDHLGEKSWALYGQSYGGFLIMAYLSMFPDAIMRAYMTGGMPGLEHSIDEVYRATYAHLAQRHQQWFREYPWVAERIQEICVHLENSQEMLPQGFQLTQQYFRTLGIQLGRGDGPHALAYLLEDPFHTVRGEKRLQAHFLAEVGAQLSAQARPLYSAIHETIYGGCGGQAVTNWAAERIRAEIPGFAPDVPTGEQLLLTGEHIFPWQFDADPALQAFAPAAQELAQHAWPQAPYDVAVLAQVEVPIAATMYVDDIFVPLEISQASARLLRDVRPHITNQWQHDGIRHAGAQLFAQMHKSLEQY